MEHGCNGAVRARSEQGQSIDGQYGAVSRQASGMQLQTYERTITLSRERGAGEQVSVRHPPSCEEFQLGP